ncbi:hypothetical protein HMPREF9554_01810 [Treponema phagedenis F0421]|nr:hypothetical protein HMPREF9554_01810 [Treponema phagedenis F0421]
MITQQSFLIRSIRIIKKFYKKSSTRHKGESLEFLPLLRQRVLKLQFTVLC